MITILLPCLWYFLVYCSDYDPILGQGPMDQHHCMQSTTWNGIYIVRRVRFPSGGFKFGKACVIMFRGSTCSKHFLFTNLTAAEKLLLTIQWYDSTLMYPKVIMVRFVLHLQVPGHLFANESPCISKFKEIIWDLFWYLGVGSASKHTDWSLQGLYDVLPIVNQVCVHPSATEICKGPL